MNVKSNEQLSALMDGELETGHAELLRNLGRDESLRGKWLRYSLISDCITGNLPRYWDPSLSGRISQAVRSEATVLAPEGSWSRTVLRPLAGLAIAASVAALAIFAIQHQRAGDGLDPSAEVAAAQPAQLLPPANRSLTFAAGKTETSPTQLSTARPGDSSGRLNRYLVNYNEYRSNAAMQGMFPYVRIVAHDREE